MILLACLANSFSPQLHLAQMSLEEKIGQLFVVPACPSRNEDHRSDLYQLFEKCHIGNVIVKASDPLSQVRLLNDLQSRSVLPLLVAADAEWGLAMRMSDTIAFPKNRTLGAISDPAVLTTLGKEIAREAKRVGVHLNLAPVVDVNSNPKNPIIGMRSFGETAEKVAECASHLMRGFHQGGLLACAKHFPGHGDTNTDSHYTLPVLFHDAKRLEEVDLVPFQRLVDEGVDFVMTAHLYLPHLDEELPTSLSPAAHTLLRERLNFQGLVISDALNMKALTKYTPEEIALLARRAGCDLLLYGDHIDPNVDEIIKETVPRAFEALRTAFLRGDLNLKELDATVLKILQKKKNIERVCSEEHLWQDLHSLEALHLKKQLFRQAITCVGDKDVSISDKTAYLSFGSDDQLNLPANDLETADQVIIAIHQKEALTDAVITIIDRYKDRAVVCLFTTPDLLPRLPKVRTVLIGYENDPDAQKSIRDLLLSSGGRLHADF